MLTNIVWATPGSKKINEKNDIPILPTLFTCTESQVIINSQECGHNSTLDAFFHETILEKNNIIDHFHNRNLTGSAHLSTVLPLLWGQVLGPKFQHFSGVQ